MDKISNTFKVTNVELLAFDFMLKQKKNLEKKILLQSLIYVNSCLDHPFEVFFSPSAHREVLSHFLIIYP